MTERIKAILDAVTEKVLAYSSGVVRNPTTYFGREMFINKAGSAAVAHHQVSGDRTAATNAPDNPVTEKGALRAC